MGERFVDADFRQRRRADKRVFGEDPIFFGRPAGASPTRLPLRGHELANPALGTELDLDGVGFEVPVPGLARIGFQRDSPVADFLRLVDGLGFSDRSTRGIVANEFNHGIFVPPLPA